MQAVQFSQPPPPIPNMLVPPPTAHFTHSRFHNSERGGHRGHFFQPFRPYPRPGPGGPDSEFDGKRLRKSVMRKTVDYNSAIIKMLECRVWQRDFRDRRALQPDVTYYPDLQPPPSYIDNAINSVTTRFVKTATNKMRCPIFCMAWTPEGRRLVTGASSGEFTLWNGLTFNFETILQAHDSPVRTMVWSHNDVWMVTGDHAGYVKYWQSNMNNVKMFQAHKEAIRGLSFSPTDNKFVTCSDDGTLRIWDFSRCYEERILRGHGADVKCVHWHPQKGLIISGSKDNQQPVKLWDPKSGNSLATLHAHKSTVMDIKWNANGNWVVTASRDHLLKLFDLRNLSQEVQTFRGHKKEASSVAWHPYHEGLFCSGGSDGAILFWHVGADKEVGGIEQAHDSIVWTLAWHPLGHILCSGSNDHTSKFWTRNRPGDLMRDKYNLNTLPAGLPGFEDQDVDDTSMIPGMGPEDKVETVSSPVVAQIPGLDFDGVDEKHRPYHKKVPYSKPIPRNFQAQWNETGKANNEDGKDDDSDEEENSWRGRKGLALVTDPITEVITQLIETNPPPGVIPLSQLQPQAIILYGKLIPVEGNPALAEAIAGGPVALNRFITSGELEELSDVIPHVDDAEDYDDYEDYDENAENENSQDVELPPPLPSSIFARNRGGAQESQQQQQQPHHQQQQQQQPLQQKQQQPRRTRFSDRDDLISNVMDGNSSSSDRGFSRNTIGAEDKDMRSLPMQPGLRSNQGPDQDMRFSGLGVGGGDLDLRQIPSGGPPHPLMGGPPRMPAPMSDRSVPHGMADQDFRRLDMDSDFRQFGEPMPRHDEDLRNHQGFDQDLRAGMGDMDLRANPAGMFPPPQQPQPLLGSHFDSDFRQLGRPHSESPHLQRPGPMPPHRDQFDLEEERGQEMPNKEDRNWQYGGPPRSLLDQEPWGMGPRKRRWGDLSADDEESNHMESVSRYNNFRPRPPVDDYYPMSPADSENSPSNGRAFGDPEDNYSEHGVERRHPGPGPEYRLHEQKTWPNRPYPPGPEGLYPMEGNVAPGGFRSRGGGIRGRGRGGAVGGVERGRGGPRGRFGAQRGGRGGRGSKRGQF